ncbi:Uncharacterized protein SCF082_LOCUS36444 [Durusdinium trenchii]|uniref:Uncharacterized protein n=1 Tax=Durusdinium trenchii TaxID=1381693 RepID=A0ABP0PIT6_9DINO
MACRPWIRSPMRFGRRAMSVWADSRALKEEHVAVARERVFGAQGSMPGDREFRKKLEGRKLMRWYFPSKYNLQDFRNNEYFEMQSERFKPKPRHPSMVEFDKTLKRIIQNRELLKRYLARFDNEEGYYGTFKKNHTLQDLYGIYRLVSTDKIFKNMTIEETIFKEEDGEDGQLTNSASGIGSSWAKGNEPKAMQDQQWKTLQKDTYFQRRHRFVDPMFRRRRLKWLERQEAGLNKAPNDKHHNKIEFYGKHPDQQKVWPTNKGSLHIRWPSPYHLH